MGRRSIALMVLVAAAAAVAWRYWPGEERKVRGRLQELADALSIPGGETGLPRAARAAGVRRFFTENVAVEVPSGSGPTTLHGRDEIASLVTRMMVPPEGTKVELSDVDIQLAEKTSADVRVNTRVMTREPKGSPAVLDARMVALTLRKLDGTWLVSNARIMPPDDSLGLR